MRQNGEQALGGLATVGTQRALDTAATGVQHKSSLFLTRDVQAPVPPEVLPRVHELMADSASSRTPPHTLVQSCA